MVSAPVCTWLPRVSTRRFWTSPVHEPQLAEALHCERTASRLHAPAWIVATTLPLDTPLQPQISASSESAATAALGSAKAPPPIAKAWPNISPSRISEMSSCFLSRSKYQLPSEVSP